jgi:hypothetical protein
MSHSSGPENFLPADGQTEAHDEINKAITAILTESFFSSLRDISRLAHISKSTIHK